MEDLAAEVRALRARMRMQGLLFFGVLAVAILGMGGAEVVAAGAAPLLTETASFKIITKNASSADTERLNVGTGENTVGVRLSNSNLVLASQSGAPSVTTAGTLWYDSTAGRLKYRNASNWAEASAICKRKSADETVTSSTTLQNDDHLQFTAGVNETWIVNFYIHATTGSDSTIPDIKFNFSAPSGATLDYWALVAPTTSNPWSQVVVQNKHWFGNNSPTCGLGGGGGSGVPYSVHLQLTVANAGTSGTVALQWAQSTSSGAGTTVKAGSSMTAVKVN